MRYGKVRLFPTINGSNWVARRSVPKIFSARFLPQCPPITRQEILWNFRSSQTW